MTKDSLRKKLGKNIALIRKEKGLSQATLGERCGKDRQNIYRLEKGNQNPTVELLYDIAKALGVPIKDFFDFE